VREFAAPDESVDHLKRNIQSLGNSPRLHQAFRQFRPCSAPHKNRPLYPPLAYDLHDHGTNETTGAEIGQPPKPTFFWRRKGGQPETAGTMAATHAAPA
jgi:hypothetical protein